MSIKPTNFKFLTVNSLAVDFLHSYNLREYFKNKLKKTLEKFTFYS